MVTRAIAMGNVEPSTFTIIAFLGGFVAFLCFCCMKINDLFVEEMGIPPPIVFFVGISVVAIIVASNSGTDPTPTIVFAALISATAYFSGIALWVSIMYWTIGFVATVFVFLLFEK